MKRLLLSVLSGLLFALSWPTYGFPGLIFFAFIPLLLVERGTRIKPQRRKKLKIFLYSYLTFLIWNFITTSWLRFADEFGAAFAILVNSLLMSLIVLIYHSAAKRTTQLKSLIFFATLWISFEFLHLGWEFSWPWLNLGNVFSEYYNWIQWYEFTGTFGGTLWVLLINLWLYGLLVKYRTTEHTFKYTNLIGPALLIVLPILISLYLFHKPSDLVEKINVVVLQPNIDPYDEKYDIPNEDIADLFIELTNREITDSTDYVVAPETVFARNVRIDQLETSLFKYKLDTYIREHPNLNILTGISFLEYILDPNEAGPETNQLNEKVWYNDFNSAILLNRSGKTQFYHKSKLVVGIENFPYQEILKPVIGDVMIDLGGTVAMKTTQEERGVFTGIENESVAGPIICYESVYGEFVTGYVRNGANFLAIITNDAWWNETQGHKQHLSYARLRAIETRRNIARSANTGISALIDEKGNITKSLAYNKKGALAGDIYLNEDLTFYTIAGDYIARISVFVMILLGLIIFFRRPRIKL